MVNYYIQTEGRGRNERILMETEEVMLTEEIVNCSIVFFRSRRVP